ncbi:MAG: single-stranded DNA-binding protein [Nitrospirae bacterium]|nr:MAG: single-stranded DNA-binding protein [Nitrospirota bacterium]
MRSLNRVQLIGNMGQDPEVRYTNSGKAVCNFSIATTHTWKNADGVQQEQTEWHKIVAWGRLAEICGQYLHKGRKVYVEGRLQTRKWQGQDGTDRYTTEVVIDNMIFLGGREGGGNGGGRPADDGFQAAPAEPAAPASSGGFDDDDIPF